MSNDSSKSVSVVLATCNGARFIEKQLGSISSQTFAPLELIVSDDASTDNTLQIVSDTLSGCGFPVRINRNEKALGFRENFLRASLLARGDFIAFSGQDDVWAPTKLERCSKFFDDQNVSLIVHTARLIDEQSNQIGMFLQGIEGTRTRCPLSYDPWGTFWGFSMVFRRELVDLVNIHDRFIDYVVPSELIAHDRWIMFLAQMVGAVVEISDPLVDYRQHSSNLFGAALKKSRARPSDVGGRSQDYIRATSQMLDVLDKIRPDIVSGFPLFDKERCREFLQAALLQLSNRHSIYASPSRLAAIQKFLRCLNDDCYKSVHDGRMRWRSLMKDARIAALGS